MDKGVRKPCGTLLKPDISGFFVLGGFLFDGALYENNRTCLILKVSLCNSALWARRLSMHPDAKQEVDAIVEIAADTINEVTDKYNADQQLVIERLLRKIGYLAGLGGFDLTELAASLDDGFQRGENHILDHLDALFGSGSSK